MGWQRPNRNTEYALIATWIGTRGTVAKALVSERKSNQLYYVARGEKLGTQLSKELKRTKSASKSQMTLSPSKQKQCSFSVVQVAQMKDPVKAEKSQFRRDSGDERRAQRAGRRGANQERDALREWCAPLHRKNVVKN